MSAHCGEPVKLKRNVDAVMVPIGARVILQAGEVACLTQAMGGSYTVVVNGNMFRIEGRDADALGLEASAQAAPTHPAAATREQVEKEVWDALRTCYDPEIPVNIVDLGLIYDCTVAPLPGQQAWRVDVKMTLTAPGCGMGPVIQQDAQAKLMTIEDVAEVNVELVWDPPWSQVMMSEAAKLQLGLL
jgi:probable FeS assembly SUF system protein SufT